MNGGQAESAPPGASSDTPARRCDVDAAIGYRFPDCRWPARLQDKEQLKPILKGSLAFALEIVEAAACMFAPQREVLPAQRIPVQAVGASPIGRETDSDATEGSLTMANRKLGGWQKVSAR